MPMFLEITDVPDDPVEIPRAAGRPTFLAGYSVDVALGCNMLQRIWHDFYWMCDASPQWRGLELWAASVDVVRLRGDADSTDVRKFLLLAPFITLPKSMRGQFAKCAAFVWQAFLID